MEGSAHPQLVRNALSRNLLFTHSQDTDEIILLHAASDLSLVPLDERQQHVNKLFTLQSMTLSAKPFLKVLADPHTRDILVHYTSFPGLAQIDSGLTKAMFNSWFPTLGGVRPLFFFCVCARSELMSLSLQLIAEILWNLLDIVNFLCLDVNLPEFADTPLALEQVKELLANEDNRPIVKEAFSPSLVCAIQDTYIAFYQKNILDSFGFGDEKTKKTFEEPRDKYLRQLRTKISDEAATVNSTASPAVLSVLKNMPHKLAWLSQSPALVGGTRIVSHFLPILCPQLLADITSAVKNDTQTGVGWEPVCLLFLSDLACTLN